MNTLYKKDLRVFTVMLLGGAFFSLCGLPAAANSAPGEPSTITSPFVVAEDTPIAVQKEDLTFVIDPKTEKKADVTAEYRMSNPTDAGVDVSMLFPVLGAFQGGAVTVDGVATEAEVTQIVSQHVNGPLKDGVLMDIGDIITLYNRTIEGVYHPQHFAPGDAVRVFTVRRTAAERDRVDYPAGSTLFAPENSGFSQDGSTVRLLSKDLGGTYEVYLLNGQSLTVNGAPAAPSSELSMSEFAAKFKSRILKNAGPDAAGMTDQAYINQFFGRVDKLIDSGGVIAGAQLLNGNFQKCTVLRYQVHFAAGAAKDIKVRYTIDAGYPAGYSDRTNSSVYEYLLNPAKYWASFKNLKITVVPGANRNRLLRSSLPLTKGRDGSYSATFQTLPETDLSFTLSPSVLAAGSGPWIVVVCAAAAVVVLGALLWRREKRRADGR